jgi:hypothetical protein
MIIEEDDTCPMFECFTCQRNVHAPNYGCGVSEDEEAYTMEISGTERWICPLCRMDITMAVARNILDEEDEEPEKRNDWEDSTGDDIEDGGDEIRDYSHRKGYPARNIRSLFSGTSIVESEDEIQAMEAEELTRGSSQAKPTFPIPEDAPKRYVTWGENQFQECPISKRDIRDRKYVDSVRKADPRYAKEQAQASQSEEMATAAPTASEPEVLQLPQEGEEKPRSRRKYYKRAKKR